MNIGAFIPAHNEVKTIRCIVEGVLGYVKTVVVVDDGSDDGTADQIKDLPVTVIKHPINQGKSQAMITGFKALQSMDVDGILTIDADSQHSPEDIPNFLDQITKTHENLIIGARLKDIAVKPKKSLIGNKIADFFVSWAGGKIITDTQSGYKFYPMSLIKQFKPRKKYKHSFLLESEILIFASRHGYDFSVVPIHAVYSDDISPSHYRPWLDTLPIVRMIAWKVFKGGFYPISLYKAIKYFKGNIFMDESRYYTTEQIKQIEQMAMQGSEGVPAIPEFELMQRAGKAAFDLIQEKFPNAKNITVFCGAGNNAGDGYVVAALAKQATLCSRCYFLKEPDSLKEPAQSAYRLAKSTGAEIKPLSEFINFKDTDLIIDALLGTGFSGKLSENYLKTIKHINNSEKSVVAIDIPSGMDANTGEVMEGAVKATMTMTFIGKKQAFSFEASKSHSGDVYLDTLGLSEYYFKNL